MPSARTVFGYSNYSSYLPSSATIGSVSKRAQSGAAKRWSKSAWAFEGAQNRPTRIEKYRRSRRLETSTRLFDVVVAALALIALLPVLLVVFLLVKLTSRGPGIFVQQRVGRRGVLFPCLKFRTMVVDADEALAAVLAQSSRAREQWARDQKLRDDPRITWIGALLRKSSLDELPQLFNILAGQMSVVGPRPIVTSEISRYGARFSSYCSVRPGLTGLWQVSGRNDISYSSRVRLDSLYARKRSFALNVSICLRTVPAVLSKSGSY